MSNKLIKISLMRKQKVSMKGVKFYTYLTKMMLPEVMEDGTKTSPIEKWVQVSFNRDVDLTNIKSGTIYVEPSNVNAPSVYKITKKVEVLPNGMEYESKVYPKVWIRKIEKFVPYVAKVSQSSFVNDSDDEDDGYSIPDEREDYSQFDE